MILSFSATMEQKQEETYSTSFKDHHLPTEVLHVTHSDTDSSMTHFRKMTMSIDKNTQHQTCHVKRLSIQKSSDGLHGLTTAYLNYEQANPDYQGVRDQYGDVPVRVIIGKHEECHGDQNALEPLPISNDTNIDEEILRSIHQGTCENIPHPQGILQNYMKNPDIIKNSNLPRVKKRQLIRAYEICPRHYKSLIFKPFLVSLKENLQDTWPKFYLIRPDSAIVQHWNNHGQDTVPYWSFRSIFSWDQAWNRFLGLAIWQSWGPNHFTKLLKDGLFPISHKTFQEVFFLTTSYYDKAEGAKKNFPITYHTMKGAISSK